MSVQLLSDALGAINVKYIDEVLTYEPPAKRRPAHIWLKRCVAACLAVVLCFGTFIAANAEARAAFVSWIREVYEDSFIYRYFGDSPEEELQNYTLTELPAGYTHTLTDNNGSICVQLYQYGDETITFTYYYMQDGWEHIVVEKQSDLNCTLKNVVVNGVAADLYEYENGTSASELIWNNEQENLVFHISAFLSESELIKLAEGISLKE